MGPVRNHCSAVATTIALMAAVVAGACTESSSTITSSPDALAKCGMTVGAPPTIGPDGGNATLSVTTQPECAWTASTTATWITGVTPTSGQGSGSVAYRVAANDGTAAREGEIAINDTRVRVSQRAPCIFAVTPATRNVGTDGGPGSVTIATAAECDWTATTDVSWISLTQPVSGSGNGTVNFTVSPNTGLVRTGHVVVGGQRSVVTQETSPSACTYSIAPTSQNIGAAGGAGAPIAVAAPNGCRWTANSRASWITITSTAGGNGNGSITFNAAANTGGDRTGTLSIAESTFTLIQAGCVFAVTPSGLTLDGNPQSASFTVTTTSGCQWTAATNLSWITIISGASGTGSGAVTFRVTQNDGPQRTGSMTIAGQSVSVLQRSRQ